MNEYELTFLLNDEEEIKTIASLLKSLEGKIVEEKKWGKMQFAYPIKKLESANYYTWIINMDKKNVPEFKKKLNFNEKLIRHLILDVNTS